MTHPPQSPTSTPLALAYDRVATGWQRRIDRLGYPGAYGALFAHLPPAPAGRVLDVGAGSGAFSQALLDAEHRPRSLDLLDPSAAMLAEAEARLSPRAPVRTLRAAVGADLSGAPYDTLLCAHVIEHLDDTGAALRWLRAQLRPGGQLYLAASRPHWCTALLRWKWGHRAFAPVRMTSLLTDAGFASVSGFAFPTGPPRRTSHGYRAERPALV